MRPQRLLYTYVSFASCINASWGHGTPVAGVDRTHRIVHKYGIPVTWNVNKGSVGILKDRINTWHEQYGDDVILGVEEYVTRGMTRDEIKQAVAQDWEVLRGAFSWAETKVAAAGIINNTLIQALEELDFKGLWGYCWEQSWWDSITHRGIPWGFWYIDRNRYKAPGQGEGKITACEWTARDLHLSYHTMSPCIFSSDPNDVYRAGLCTGEDIEYWKKLFSDYLNNTDHNEYVYFTHQQESHEMEITDSFAVWDETQMDASEKMLDNFFQYLQGFDITMTTLPKAVAHYQNKNRITAPSYMLTTDSDIRPQINKYTMTLGGVGLGPWPETFFYYDAQCQMAFVKGECRPRMLRNYTRDIQWQDEFQEEIPLVVVEERDDKSYIKTDHRIEIEFKVTPGKAMPFGLAYWDDLAGFSVQETIGIRETKIIGDRLVFMRIDLTGEQQKLKIVLTRN